MAPPEFGEPHRQGGEGGPGPGRGATAARLTSPAGKQAVRQADAMLQFLVRLREAAAAPPFRGGAGRSGAERNGARGRRAAGRGLSRGAGGGGDRSGWASRGESEGLAVPPPLLLL